LCSGDLISDRWITYLLKNGLYEITFYIYDYVPGQFKSLSMFCQQAQQTIDDALRIILQAQFVSSQVISQQLFELEGNLLIQDWKSTIPNTFMCTIQLVRAIAQGKQLSDGYLICVG
jgi:hypothetical protein